MNSASFDPNATFQEILTAAINDMASTGYVSRERLDEWLALLRNAAERELGPEWEINDTVRRDFTRLLTQFTSGAKLDQRVPGISRYTKAMIAPKLHAELDRRILAAADLIKLHRQEAVERTLRRFAGWSTSIPPGGDETIDRRKIKAAVKKDLIQYNFERRRCDTDQGHKLVANVASLVATEAGAIAGRWHSHGAHDASYDARPEHLKRDGKLYLIRDSWAHRQGLVKPMHGFTDDITAPGQEVSCRCYYEYVTSPRRLPDEMLTKKGQEFIRRGNEEFAKVMAT